MLNDIFDEELLKARNELSNHGFSESEIDSKLSEIGQKLFNDFSISFLEKLINNGKTSVREHKFQDDEFKCRLEFRWYKAFDLLEILIGCSLEVVEEIDENEIEENLDVFQIIKRLHARSIRIAKEIVILMRNGYADGALARWRSLFEICTTVMFVDRYGKQVADMYKEYQHIENFNEMIEYQKRCEGLGFKPIDDSQINEIKKKKEELEHRYSSRYCQLYGWTCSIFPTGKLSFNRIIDDIGFELWKPYYKMACNSVHAGPKAIFYNIGLSERQDILLVGPTNIGFVDPAQLTSISLTQITTFLIKRVPNFERILVNNALDLLTTRITDEFIRIQKEIDEEEDEKERLTKIST